MTQPRLLGGRYELDGVVGRGGMAEVYRARDLRLDRIVAVKTLREDLARDQTFQARFRREAQSAASLNHPSIVAVYDTGEDQGAQSHVPFIVMEYVDGRTIRDLLRDDRRLLPERALEITDGVLRALDYSHRNGIVHRDIKPGNVMLNRTGEIKVMDFGIARSVSDSQATMTQTAQVIGTAQYLSPEQARGERVDARSDLYSVGCLLYELLTGRPPFTGDSPVAIAYQHVRENPIPPSRVDPELPGWADPIVLKAMAKDPADRYQSAADMRGDIQRAIGGYPIAAQMPPPGFGGGPGTRRMDAMGNTRTQMQRPTGAIPPYEYGAGYGAEDGGQGPRDYRRKKRPIWPWVAAIVALIVLGGGYFAYQTISGNGSGVAIPDVTGKSLTQAENIITQNGLTPNPVSQTSPTGPYNQVISENPSPGSKVARGSSITLNYYVRPGTKSLPDVSGMTQGAATDLLKKDGWTNVVPGTTPVASSTVPSGDVVNTSPPTGSQVPFGDQVTLNISGGGTVMPNLVGLTQANAQTKLTALGLTPNFVTGQASGYQPGVVFATIPAAGKVVLPDSIVTVEVTPASSSSSPSSTPSSSSTSPSPTGTPSSTH